MKKLKKVLATIALFNSGMCLGCLLFNNPYWETYATVSIVCLSLNQFFRHLGH